MFCEHLYLVLKYFGRREGATCYDRGFEGTERPHERQTITPLRPYYRGRNNINRILGAIVV